MVNLRFIVCNTMKRSFFHLTVVIVLTVTIAACTADVTILPLNVTLSQTTATLAPGEELTLTSVVMPDGAAIKNLTWSSSDPTVAVVDNGIVTALNEGVAIITVTTNSGNKSANCKLLVAYPVSGVEIGRVPALMTVGQNLKLTATVIPYDAPDKSVTWSSSDPNVAEIDDGVVTSKTLGTATITVITEVGARTAQFTVKVVPENYVFIYITLQSSFMFSLFGDGTVDIDWGDISAIESSTLSFSSSDLFYHNYDSGSLPFTVVIAGENISNLTCNSSRIMNLDVSKCATLETLYCYNNLLRSLDIKNNSALTELNCSQNQLTSLDMTCNTMLQNINCSINQLSAGALNTLFETLHDVIISGEQKLIYIQSNPGTDACDTSIAMDKGWIIR